MEEKITFVIPKKWKNFVRENRIYKGIVEDLYSDGLFTSTSFGWSVQTFLRLKEVGYECECSSTIPEKGIIFINHGKLEQSTIPTSDQFIVSIIGDGSWRPYANYHITLNPVQAAEIEHKKYIDHWPLPGLKPRKKSRKNNVKNIGYFGHTDQLAPILKSSQWRDFIQKNGMRWINVFDEEEHRTNDFSNIDINVAVRSFDQNMYEYKPASKLINGWLAGVPSILGKEYAYRNKKKSKLDYIEVETYKELKKSILKIKHKNKVYKKMKIRCKKRSQKYSVSKIRSRWINLIEREIKSGFKNWKKSNKIQKILFFTKRYLLLKKRGLVSRVPSFFESFKIDE